MESLFHELKRAREAKRLSVDDVSDATLINVSFLRAIEQGKTDILPQTYVRAFIREYASFVGLDPAETMKRYDQIQTPTPPPAEQPIPVPSVSQPEETATVEQATRSTPRTPTVARFALPGILILVAGIIIWNLSRTKTPLETKEIPIDTIVKKPETMNDSTTHKPAVSQQQAMLVSVDSLTLRATTSDSAWVEIVIDDMKPQEYLFRASRKISWKAKQRFRITTGNAGAIDLTLNDKHLGAPGKRGAVVRNVEFNRQTLLQK